MTLPHFIKRVRSSALSWIEIILLRFCFLWLLVILSMTFGNIDSFAETGSEPQKKGKDVKKYRFKIHKLQEGILKQEDKFYQSQSKEKVILEELEILDKKLVEQAQALATLEFKMEDQQKQINIEKRALVRIDTEKQIVQDHLKSRISSYYTMGDIGLLNVTFSTKTLPELLAFHDAFDALIQYDKDVIDVYKETLDEVRRIKNLLDLEKSVLEEFISQARVEKELLEKTKNQKSNLLTMVRTQAKLHQQAVLEMKRASQELAESIVAIKNKNETYEKGFSVNKGSLPPPVDGTLITLFNQEKTNKLGIKKPSQGIELQAKNGTSVIAVSDGKVVFAGYLRGYGNTIVIHHGYKYYTVTSRIEKILVEQGQKIKREQVLGLMGSTATLFDDGLYFEIRHGTRSLDPLLWLNPNRLTAASDKVNNPLDATEKVVPITNGFTEK